MWRAIALWTLGAIAGLNPVAPFVFAFEIAPEYRVLDEDEQRGFDDIGAINAEYQSDFLTFMFHPREERVALSARSYAGTVGSLGRRDFLVRHDLNLQIPLPDDFEFRLRHFSLSDAEDKGSHQILEFIYWRNGWGYGVFGEPTAEKRSVDVGLAFLQRPDTSTENRLYVSWPDFQRNQRNERDDRFVHAPFAVGARRLKLRGDETYSLFNVRYEAPVRWRFPAAGAEYRFHRTYLGYSSRRESRWRGYWNFRGETRVKFEETRPWVGGVVAGRKLTSQRALLFLSHEGERFEPGFMLSARRWLGDGQLAAGFYQPFLWYKWRTVGRSVWRVGGEVTTGDVDGELPGVQESTSRTETRFNVEWSRRLTGNGKLIALFTFDGDDLISREAWEGGNVRLVVNF